MNSVRKGFRFPIDKLTNSVERIATGESIVTDVTLVSKNEIRRVHKKDGWLFNWKKEFREKGRTVYKLVLTGDQIIQGLVSIEPVTSQYYIEIHLIENAPHISDKRKNLPELQEILLLFAAKWPLNLDLEVLLHLQPKLRSSITIKAFSERN